MGYTSKNSVLEFLYIILSIKVASHPCTVTIKIDRPEQL
jgi:hypothetical protein